MVIDYPKYEYEAALSGSMHPGFLTCSRSLKPSHSLRSICGPSENGGHAQIGTVGRPAYKHN